MWLINARTLRLVYIEDEAKTPRYAILSHTWGNGEISFREMMALNSRLARKPKKKPGWSKVVNTCRLALSYKCDYAWIDTCCIDTSSSAELQEAINSMFQWYERAEICFVHLEDVAPDEDYKKPDCSFRKSRWFRRGWTLQEMLAPATLVFYDTAWSVISDKDDEDLRTIITEITGIDDYYLSPGNRKLFANAQQWLSHASVAERMSWAAGRETTRKEDLAYSLLGIFNINMPMLYGEGMKAFQRLQEEIMKIDDDSSLLCWGFGRPSYQTSEYDDESSILATHPDTFKQCRNIKPCVLPGFEIPSFTLSQRGLRMRAPVRDDITHEHLSYVVLGCGTDRGDPAKAGMSLIAVPLVSKDACSSHSSAGVTQAGEYFRPTWCRPTLVSAEFLAKAETRDVLIRRPPKEPVTILRCPFRLLFHDSIFFQAAGIIAMYPPQPLPGAVAWLGRQSRQQSLGGHIDGSYQANYEYAQKAHGSEFKQELRHRGDVQIMIHFRFPSKGFFLVTVELSNLTEQRKFRCRVFRCHQELGFENLHALSISQDYSQLQVLTCSRDEGGYYCFNLDEESRMKLAVMYTSMSDIDRIIIGA